MAKQEDGWSQEVEVDGSKTIQGVPMCHDVRRGNQESWTGLDKLREYSGLLLPGVGNFDPAIRSIRDYFDRKTVK